MSSEEIFAYSEGFLNEIIDDLVELKKNKLSSPKSNEFDKRLKTLMGKSLDEKEFKELVILENADFMDVLKVKNIKSGKIIYGFAKNENKVVLKTKQN